MRNTFFSILLIFMGNNALAANSQITENLGYIITPVREDQADILNAQRVCECVAAFAKEKWSVERYNSFAIELNHYATAMQEAIKDMNALVANGPPTKSEVLQADLKFLVKYIEPCEKQFDAKVEY